MQAEKQEQQSQGFVPFPMMEESCQPALIPVLTGVALALLSALFLGTTIQTKIIAPKQKKPQLLQLTLPNIGIATPSRTVKVGFHLNHVSNIDIKRETFDADLYLWFVWKAPKKENLAIEFPNSIKVSKDDFNSDGTYQNGTNHRGFRIRGTFRSDFDHEHFPFDDQNLKIQIEDGNLDISDMQFIIDPQSTIPSDFKVGEWLLDQVEVKRDVHDYKTTFGNISPEKTRDSRYSTVSIQLHILRNVIPYLIKSLMPLVIILWVAALVFFIDPRMMPVRSSLAVTTLLSLIASHMNVNSNLSGTGYTTSFDRVYIIGYFLISLVILNVVISSHVRRENIDRMARLNHTLGAIYPSIIILAIALVIRTTG